MCCLFSWKRALISKRRYYSISVYVIFQKAGLQALLKGTKDLSGLRGPLCSIILIAYHTVVCYVLGKYSKFSRVLFSPNNSKLFFVFLLLWTNQVYILVKSQAGPIICCCIFKKPSQDLSIVFKDLYYLRHDKTGHTIFGLILIALIFSFSFEENLQKEPHFQQRLLNW